MQIALKRITTGLLTTAFFFTLAGCQSGAANTTAPTANPPEPAAAQHDDDIAPDQLIVEVTLLRLNLSNHSAPAVPFDLWTLLESPIDTTQAIEAIVTGQDFPQPTTELHVAEVTDAPRLIRALDAICDTCLVASPKFTMLRQRGPAWDAIYIPGPGPYAGPPSPTHPLDAFGLRFAVDHWDGDSTTFNLSVARYPQLQPEGQEVLAVEGGPDYSGEHAVLRQADATFEDGKTYLVGGFADWRHVGPVTAWGFDDEQTTEVQEEELIAIIKVTRVVEDVLIPIGR